MARSIIYGEICEVFWLNAKGRIYKTAIVAGSVISLRGWKRCTGLWFSPATRCHIPARMEEVLGQIRAILSIPDLRAERDREAIRALSEMEGW
jgi:hypothetical protein